MASYSSDFIMENHLPRERVLELLAKYTLKNQELKINEAAYEIHVFMDGQKIIEDGRVSWDGHHRYMWREEDYPDDFYEQEARYEKEASALLEEKVRPLEEMARKKHEEALAAERKRQADLYAAHQRARRNQYEQLKKEFGDEA
jgi:hypothetical protein